MDIVEELEQAYREQVAPCTGGLLHRAAGVLIVERQQNRALSLENARLEAENHALHSKIKRLYEIEERPILRRGASHV